MPWAGTGGTIASEADTSRFGIMQAKRHGEALNLHPETCSTGHSDTNIFKPLPVADSRLHGQLLSAGSGMCSGAASVVSVWSYCVVKTLNHRAAELAARSL